jgi:uncharacterized protein (TIGR03067 family)
MQRQWIVVPAALAATAVLAPARDDRGPQLSPEAVRAALGAARRLGFELERALEDVAEDLQGGAERDLYRQAGAAAGALQRLQRTLRAQLARRDVYADFAEVERHVDGLAAGADKLGPDQRVLRRDADHIRRASRQLFAALTEGDASEETDRKAIRGLAGVVAADAASFRRALRFALPDGEPRRRLEKRLDRLAQEAGELGKADAEGGRERLRRSFASLSRAWAEVREELTAQRLSESAPGLVGPRTDRLQEPIEQLAARLGGGGRPAFDAPRERTREEMEKWQGRWRLVSTETGGQRVADDPGWGLVVRGDQVESYFLGKLTGVTTVRVDPSRSPPGVEMTVLSGDRETRSYGIYELRGDTLRYCLAGPGDPPPTRFETAPGTGYQLFTWRRE